MTVDTVKPRYAGKKLNPEVKEAWVTALKSGDYRQGQGRLHTVGRGGGDSFCCLGVLCKIGEGMGVAEASDGREFAVSYRIAGRDLDSWNDMMPSAGIREWAGLPHIAADGLAEMNDTEGASFTRIAEYIEEHL